MVDKERPKTGIRDMLDSLYRETKLARNTGVFDRKQQKKETTKVDVLSKLEEVEKVSKIQDQL